MTNKLRLSAQGQMTANDKLFRRKSRCSFNCAIFYRSGIKHQICQLNFRDKPYLPKTTVKTPYKKNDSGGLVGMTILTDITVGTNIYTSNTFLFLSNLPTIFECYL